MTKCRRIRVIIEWDYVLAWVLYIGAGLVACVIWWRMTANLRQVVVRQILRGTLLVLLFTPWFADSSGEHFAPAAVVLIFEHGFAASDSDYGSFYALLTTFCLMLVYLGARQFRK